MILFINTAEKEIVEVGLLKKGNFFLKKVKSHCQKSEKLLGLIEKLLNSKRIRLKSLKKILVVRGPGGFTAVRIGIAVANALAFSLKIPVIGISKAQLKKAKPLDLIHLKPQKIVMPLYGKQANITLPKKKWLK